MTKTIPQLESLLESRTQALEKCENRFRNILSRNVDGVLVVDEDGVLRFLNPAAESMLGRKAEDLFGREIGFPVVVGEATEVDIFCGRNPGAVAEMRVVATEWEGRPARLASLRDVTERIRIVQENARLLMQEQNVRKQLEHASQSKDQFIATVSHELRTPLSAVLAWTSVLQSGTPDKATLCRGLQVIERNAKTQSRLIDDMLDVSRIINGKLVINIQPIDLCKIIEAAAESLALAAQAKGVQINRVLETSSIPLHGDGERLHQVVSNLLTNAIRHTPKGGEIRVCGKTSDVLAEITVSDSGEGIPTELLPHIFDRFRQGDTSTIRLHRGLGLGLTIVRHIVELHGGSVHADSAGAGRGSTFTARIPLVSKTHSVRREALNETIAVPSGQIAEALSGLNILLVEDDADVREILTTSLRACKANVTAAESVCKALQALETVKIDVLVSDIAMPDEDGYSLIRKVRATRKNLPAAALSANAHAADRDRALSAGFQLFIPKPVDPVDLAQHIATLARR